MFRIGVDVGGTNTDAVVMEQRAVRAVVKVPTTPDVMDGLMQALGQVLEAAALAPDQVGLVVIGTTQFTNAVIERRHLTQTAVVRLARPANRCLPPMVDWPEDLRAAVGEHIFEAAGGFNFDGTPITPLAKVSTGKRAAVAASIRVPSFCDRNTGQRSPQRATPSLSDSTVRRASERSAAFKMLALSRSRNPSWPMSAEQVIAAPGQCSASMRAASRSASSRTGANTPTTAIESMPSARMSVPMRAISPGASGVMGVPSKLNPPAASKICSPTAARRS